MDKDLIAEARKMIESLYFGEYDNEKIEEGAYSILYDLCTALEDAEAENAHLRAELARVTAERDAAVKDLHGYCKACAYMPKALDIEEIGKPICRDCNKVIRQNWQWRGQQKAEEGEGE